MQHHWSGWPGAYCLHCGQSDPWEYAIGNSLYDPYHEVWVETEEAETLKKETEAAMDCPTGYSKHCGQCKTKEHLDD